MRVEIINRSAPVAEIRRREPASAISDHAVSTLDSGGDLLALTTGTSDLGSREAVVEQLQVAWRSGVFRPDPERLASRLVEWGFESRSVE